LWQLAHRFICFSLVGASGVVIDMGILFLLSDPKTLAWPLTLSKVLAAEGAIINNFTWNDAWTFRDVSSGQVGWKCRVNRFVKFNLICLAGIGLSVLLLNAQVLFLRLNVYLANFIAIFLACFWNFGMNLQFGWGKPRVTSPHGKIASVRGI